MRNLSKLPTSERNKQIDSLGSNALLEHVQEAIKMAMEDRVDIPKNTDQLLKASAPAAKKQGLKLLLNLLEQNKKTVDDQFSGANEADAFIEIWKSEELPRSRKIELLHKNIAVNDEASKVRKYLTFLTYVAAKDEEVFLKAIVFLEATISKAQFENYLYLQNFNGIGKTNLDIFQMYLEDHGDINSVERKSASSLVKGKLFEVRKEITNVQSKNYSAEKLNVEQIVVKIKDGSLPLLFLSPEFGHISTLNYLEGLKGKKQLISEVVKKIINSNIEEYSTRTALIFLANSNLPKEFAEAEIFKVKGASIQLRDLASLSEKNIEVLRVGENILDYCIDSPALLLLYISKVGITAKEINGKYRENKDSFAHLAARCLGTTLFITLIEKGLKEFDLQNKYGRTPLHYAAILGNMPLLKLLIKIGADVNSKDKWGMTALHYAADKDNEDVIKCLVDNGARNLKNKDGKTPLNICYELRSFENGNIIKVAEAERNKKLVKVGCGVALCLLAVGAVYCYRNPKTLAEAGTFLSNKTSYLTDNSVCNAICKFAKSIIEMFAKLIPASLKSVG